MKNCKRELCGVKVDRLTRRTCERLAAEEPSALEVLKRVQGCRVVDSVKNTINHHSSLSYFNYCM